MSQFLRGNFDPKKTVAKAEAEEDDVDRFEREAMKRLGGSITFVSRKKFVWSGDDSDKS